MLILCVMSVLVICISIPLTLQTRYCFQCVVTDIIIIIIICLPVIIPHYHNCIYSVHLLYTFVGVFNEILLLLILTT